MTAYILETGEGIYWNGKDICFSAEQAEQFICRPLAHWYSLTLKGRWKVKEITIKY